MDSSVSSTAWTFLGAFPKLRKPTVSLVNSVCAYIRMEQLGSQWTYFNEIWPIFFENLLRKFKFH